MPNDSMGNETEGKLIINSRGTVRDVLATSKKPDRPEIDPDDLAEKIGQSVSKALKEQAGAADPLRSVAEVVAAGAALLDEAGELAESVRKQRDVSPNTHEISPRKDYSKLSVSELELSIARAEKGSEEINALRFEKQARVDELVKGFNLRQGKEMHAYIEGIIKDRLKMITPDYYQVPLDELRGSGQGGKFFAEDNSRLKGLYTVVFGNEVDNVLLKIYEAAETSTDPVMNRVGARVISSTTERVDKSRIRIGVNIENPADFLKQLPPTFEEWKDTNRGNFDPELEAAAANWYKRGDEEKRMGEMRENLLKMELEARKGAGSRIPEDIMTLPERKTGEGSITDETIKMWGLPIWFTAQDPNDIQSLIRIRTAGVLNEIMGVGQSPYEQALFGSKQLTDKITFDEKFKVYYGLIPILKLCSDGSRKIGDLIGGDKDKGKYGAYGVHEILTAKFLLAKAKGENEQERDINAKTREVLGFIYALAGYEVADKVGYTTEQNKFLAEYGKRFQALRRAVRSSDLEEQRNALEQISNKVAEQMGVDKGLARICLEIHELLVEPGFNYDLGRLRQFYYQGAAGYPNVLEPLALDVESANTQRQTRIDSINKTLSKVREKLKTEQTDDVKNRLKREIKWNEAELKRENDTALDKQVAFKVERVKQARLGALRNYHKEKLERINVEKMLDRKAEIAGLSRETDLLDKEIKNIEEGGNNYISKWGDTLIKRYGGDGLFSPALGVIDHVLGVTLSDTEGEALGFLPRCLYLKAEGGPDIEYIEGEESVKSIDNLRRKMKGVIIEKGNISLAEGLAKGGVEVMIEMMGRLGATKLEGAWGSELTILSSLDKMCGLAQRRDDDQASLLVTDIYIEMKKSVKDLRKRQPFTLLSKETIDRIMTLSVVPPESREESGQMRAVERAAEEDARRIRSASFFDGIRVLGGEILDQILGFIPWGRK